MELARQIKRHRSELGLSQEELALKIYVTRQTVSNWETDRTYPDVESLLLLSVLFDVTVDELIKGDVEAMKKAVENDYKKMMALGWGGMVIVIAGTAATVGGISWWDWGVVPSVIIGYLVWGIGFALFAKANHLMKQNDLVTYRELIAYSKGEPIDRDNPKSRRARQHRVLKGAILFLVAAAIGAVTGYYSYAFGLFG